MCEQKKPFVCGVCVCGRQRPDPQKIMFEDADNFADFFRGGLPYYILFTLPILIICSSNPVLATSEFNVQRMAQYDVHGVPYGKCCDE